MTLQEEIKILAKILQPYKKYRLPNGKFYHKTKTIRIGRLDISAGLSCHSNWNYSAALYYTQENNPKKLIHYLTMQIIKYKTVYKEIQPKSWWNKIFK